MYTEEEIRALGIEEDELTDEEVLLLLAALHTTLSALEKELRAFYSAYGKDGVVTLSDVKKWVSSKNHVKRIVFLNQAISDIFDAGFKDFVNTFENHLMDIISMEANRFGVVLDIDDILNTGWGMDGQTWLQRLGMYRDRWTTTLANDLKVSILRQDSIVDVLLNMGKRGESMEKILKRRWRTESNAISSIARQKSYEQLGIKKYRFIHDDKCVCEKCTAMDGQIFPVSEYVVGVTANPLHENCRDYTLPVKE